MIEVEGVVHRDAEQIAPLVSIAVGFAYAEETGSGEVFRIEKTDQVYVFARIGITILYR